MRQAPIQDVYLAEVKRQGVPVVVYLVNGFQLRGVVKRFRSVYDRARVRAQVAFDLQTCGLDDFAAGPAGRAADPRGGRRAVMNATVPFVKMNGTRNEFVIVDGRETPLDDPVAFALRICDPSRGLGRGRVAAGARLRDGRRAHARHQRRRQRGRDVRQRHPLHGALSRRARRACRSRRRDARRGRSRRASCRASRTPSPK